MSYKEKIGLKMYLEPIHIGDFGKFNPDGIKGLISANVDSLLEDAKAILAHQPIKTPSPNRV